MFHKLPPTQNRKSRVTVWGLVPFILTDLFPSWNATGQNTENVEISLQNYKEYFTANCQTITRRYIYSF